MLRALLLDGNIVVNTILADLDFEHPDFKVLFSDAGEIGDTYVARSKTFKKPVVSPQPGTPEQVDAERDRRIAAGFAYQGERFQSRPQDQDNIRDAYLRALAAIAKGGGAVGDVFWFGDGEAFGWIAEDNTVMALDAPGMVELGDTIGKRKKDLTFAGAALKARIRSGEVVADVTVDSLWPA